MILVELMTDIEVGGPGLVLIVQDDAERADELHDLLSELGFATRWCASASIALKSFHETRPDLVVMEVGLAGRSGLDVCREIRRESDVPIILVSTGSATEDIVEGFRAGADDYIVEPFAGAELLVRVQARMRRRRNGIQARHTVMVDDLEVDVDNRQVRRHREPINVTPTEFKLLVTLVERPGHVFSREELLAEVWGYGYAGDERVVTVHVQRLRAKIEADPDRPRIVTTVRGLGYRLGHTTDVRWIPEPLTV